MNEAGSVAAVDCGTNSTRLLVVDPRGEVVERHMQITRLGERVDATRLLSEEAISRTLEVLREYRSIMDQRGVVATRAAATSATRDATNSEEFFSAARAIIGVRPELLSGDEEGRLSFLGATAHLPDEMLTTEPILVVDIGGGSTELVVGRPGTGEGPAATQGADGASEITAMSCDVGCVRVSERFFLHDPPTEDELHAARSFVDSTLTAAREKLPSVGGGGTIVGLAGTVSTIAALEKELAVYDRSTIHHLVLSKEQIARWAEILEHEDSASRLARTGMVRGREDVIAGGALVLDSAMRVFEARACLVSEDDILDGLAATLRSSLVSNS